MKRIIVKLLVISSAFCVISCATLHEPTPYLIRNKSGGLVPGTKSGAVVKFERAEKYLCFEPRDFARYMESVQRLIDRLQTAQ